MVIISTSSTYSRPCLFKAYTILIDVMVFLLACTVYVTAYLITFSKNSLSTPLTSSYINLEIRFTPPRMTKLLMVGLDIMSKNFTTTFSAVLTQIFLSMTKWIFSWIQMGVVIHYQSQSQSLYLIIGDYRKYGVRHHNPIKLQ